jgi:hypothetical protein
MRFLTRVVFGFCVVCLSVPAFAEFRAGAVLVDVTPEKLPVLINGGMLSRTASDIKTRIHARAIVLDGGGAERVAIVVVDSCMLPRPLLDEVKQEASKRTRMRPDRMLISATHAHSVPAAMGCLGTDLDESYVPLLREKLIEALVEAERNLEPARVGFAVGKAPEFTAVRRWIRRPDRMETDPFGNRTVRANMHAAQNWDNVTGESGPEDPDLTIVSFQSKQGRPIAVLGNFSMHYFGDEAISADYFGLFSEGLKLRLAQEGVSDRPAFVGMMSHGCSGDIWLRDYTKPQSEWKQGSIESYTEGLLDIALKAYETIEYRDDVDVAMAEKRLPLKYRVPDAQRLEWARRVVASMGDRLPQDTTEVYAREQVILHERQSTEVVVQAIRVGDILIASTPTETYALTGLKLKLQSPLAKTMVIELANGGDGYIPPPEQHLLGGYNTWPARSAGLEVQAEPKITDAVLQLLEMVAGRPRRHYVQSRGPAATAILNAKPAAYWRLDEFSGPEARDSSDRGRDGSYEPGVVFFLEGPQSQLFSTGGETNRAPHFAGGRMRTRLANLSPAYSVSLWFWNGMPVNGRDITGWMFSRGRDSYLLAHGDHLGIGGLSGDTGKVIYQNGDGKPVGGRTAIERWRWNHLVMVRDRDRVRVFLNGNREPEIDIAVRTDFPPSFDQLFFGGRSDNSDNWEGRLDEIAVFDRALSTTEVEALSIRR